MWAYGRITPPLPFKELHRPRFIATGFGHALDYVRFRKLGMFLIIHGIIFHEEVGHRLGVPPHKNRNLRYLHTPEIEREYVDNANWLGFHSRQTH